MIKFLDLKKQFKSIEPEIVEAMTSVLESTSFIGGEFVRKFEQEFANYNDAAGCLGVGNGTDALEIAIEALKLKSGGEVIVPANTFIATSEAVTRNGLKVVFCDVDPETYTIDTKDLVQRITKNTVAVIPVHLYGHPCNMDAICEIAAENNLAVIEDCAQAHGAEWNGRKVGSFGSLSTFSFYPGKNLGAYGDAGAIISNDTELLESCKKIANHGRVSKYDHSFEGRNSRLDALQAAILLVKLRHLDKWTAHRIEIASLYQSKISNTKLTFYEPAPYVKHVYHLFVIRSEVRDRLKQYLTDKGVETGIHYPISLPRLKAYSYLGEANSEGFGWDCGSKLLSIPIGDQLDLVDAEYVADVLNQFE